MARRLTQREIEADVSREVARVVNDYTPAQTPVRRCRVCLDPEARERVNIMLAHLMSPADIVRNLDDVNSKRPKNRQIKYWSVREHREKHFNIQVPAQAAWVRMMERYRDTDAELVGEGVESILTAKGYLAVIASKGYQNLVKEETEVPFDVGVNAQIKLEDLEKADKGAAQQAALRRDVALIQQAIREEFDDDQMRRLSRRLSILRGEVSEDDEDKNDTMDAEIDDDWDDGEADFDEDVDDEDTLE